MHAGCTCTPISLWCSRMLAITYSTRLYRYAYTHIHVHTLAPIPCTHTCLYTCTYTCLRLYIRLHIAVARSGTRTMASSVQPAGAMSGHTSGTSETSVYTFKSTHMFIPTTQNLFIDTSTDWRRPAPHSRPWTALPCLCVDVCTDVCADTCADVCADMCAEVCGHVYGRVQCCARSEGL